MMSLCLLSSAFALVFDTLRMQDAPAKPEAQQTGRFCESDNGFLPFESSAFKKLENFLASLALFSRQVRLYHPRPE